MWEILGCVWEVTDGFEGEEQDFIGNVKFDGEPVKMLDGCFIASVHWLPVKFRMKLKEQQYSWVRGLDGDKKCSGGESLLNG